MITPLVSAPQSNLSVAWAHAFLSLREKGRSVRHPAVVTITGFAGSTQIEDADIRHRLDQELKSHGKKSCATVAGTIFPSSMWNPKLSNDMDVLFARYEHAWPGISKCSPNRKGVYFRRLTAYQPKTANAVPQNAPVNQLKVMIDTYRTGNHRTSALQAAIFDPTRDHSPEPYLGFPCLQQVAFTPIGDDLLSVTGFYAKQLHFEKSYGNYLGLYELGRFVAKQLGLKLAQVVCVTGCLESSDSKISKGALDDFEADIRRLLGVR